MSLKNHMNRFSNLVLDIPPSKVAGQPPETEPTSESGEPTTPDAASAAAGPPRNKRLSAPGALAFFSKDFTDLEAEVSRLKASQGLPAEIALSDLQTSPYQTRRLNETKLAELIANLALNPLSTPITVRKLDNGKYEIIAGHHRVEAFRRLGRAHISASVIGITDSEAERVVFYDNLLAPKLSDYEKYLGFAHLRKSRGLSLDQLATESGMSRTLIFNLLCFDRLPAVALTMVDKYPESVSANLVAKLVTLPESAAERTAEAIEMIGDGRLTQSNAIGWIQQRQKPTKPETTTIRSGRLKYADVVRKDNHFTIKFSDVTDAEEIESALMEFLQQRASKG